MYVGDEPMYDALLKVNIYGLFLDGILDTGWCRPDGSGPVVTVGSRLSKVP